VSGTLSRVSQSAKRNAVDDMLTKPTPLATIDSMRHPLSVGFAAALLLPACRDASVTSDTSMSEGGDDAPSDGPGFEVVYRTMHIDLAPGFTQPVCRGTLDDLDRYVDTIARLLDIGVDQRTTVYWYNEHAAGALADDGVSCDMCSSVSTCGCYAGNGVVHANFRILHHELVHAVVSPAWGRSDIVFEEGIAVGLDRDEMRTSGARFVHSLLTDERPTEVAGGMQHGGGHFTRWLLDRYGPATLRELFSPRLDGSSTKEEVFAAVEEVFGMPFEQLEAEYFATAPTIYPAPGLCDGLVDIPWSDDRWELRVAADCDAPHVIGPLDVDATKPPDEPAPMAVVVTVDVPAELDGVTLAAWVPSDELATLWPCLDAPSSDPDPELAQQEALGNSVGGALRAGRYRLELPVYEPGEVYMRICPHNGAPPSLDPTIDPEHCVGD
jgi:hypothetical protein